MKLDPLAELILCELSTHAECDQIVLGGYFAMQHYVDYRATHDIDAWWKDAANVRVEAVIRAGMQRVASAKNLVVAERRFGETISFELRSQSARVFSFQIAVRSIALEPPVPSNWPPILIETLADNVASKMNALVERGAPRDFTDIFHVVDAGLMTSNTCWNLWEKKNPGGTIESATQRAAVHLSSLEQRRPLSSIADEHERARAAKVRLWIRQELFRR